MDAILHKVNQRTTELQDTLDKKAEGYSQELKEYVEKAAELYQGDILRCSEQQQAKLTQLITAWEDKQNKPPKDQALSTTTPAYSTVPAQVDIPTNDSLMGMSRRSIDPPETPTIPQRQQQTRSVLDVRVRDVDRPAREQKQQHDGTRNAAPSHDRWTEFEAPQG